MTFGINSLWSVIIAAAIAGLVSLLGLIISKENKTSEFRQAWIDGLRSDLSSLISSILSYFVIATNSSNWKETIKDISIANKCIANIRLRLNPSENQTQALLSDLKSLEVMFSGKILSPDDVDALAHKIVADSQVLLKYEWKRVRKGELGYQIVRGVSFAVLLMSVIIFIVMIIH